jgi:hypothetical protein
MTTATTASPPIKSASEAEALGRHFVEILNKLVEMVEQETALVRAGKLGAAADLAPVKAELTRLYMADLLRLRANQPMLTKVTPRLIEQLHRRHDEFRAILQMNLTVLATAHAVSESIVRGVSGEMNRKAAPQTYGSSGRANAPAPRASQPLAVSRSL